MNIDGALLAFLAVFARAASYLTAAPLFGDRMLSARIRVGAAALFAGVVASARPPMTVPELLSALPLEILFGLAAGFAARLIMAAADVGGQLIGIQLGLGFASFLDPATQEEALPTRRLAWCLASLAFLSAGGLDGVARVLAAAPLSGHGLDIIESLGRGGEVLSIGVRIAGPSLVAGLVFNLALALSSKASPALNLFSTALPILLLGGGMALFLTAPAFASELSRLAERAASLLGGGW